MVREGAVVEDELIKQFKTLDSNRNGFVDRRELAEGMRRCKLALPREVRTPIGNINHAVTGHEIMFSSDGGVGDDGFSGDVDDLCDIKLLCVYVSGCRKT